MTRRLAYQKTQTRLEAAGLPALEARWLLSRVLEQAESAPLDLQGDLTLAQTELLEQLLERRVAGYPLQYLLGSALFCGLPLEVRPGVLIPRPETEGLVELVQQLLPSQAVTGLDVGTGSGAIALALSHLRPQDQWSGTDINPAAVELARHNAAQLGLTRTRFVLAPFLGGHSQVDWVVSNPPYLPEDYRHQAPAELSHEPPEALYSGLDGLDMPLQLLQQAWQALRPGGGLALELDPGNIEMLAQQALKWGWQAVAIHPDLSRRQRYLTAQKPG